MFCGLRFKVLRLSQYSCQRWWFPRYVSLGCPVEETSKHTLSQELNAIYQNSREYHLFHSVVLNKNSESCHPLPVFSFLVKLKIVLSCPLLPSCFHNKKDSFLSRFCHLPSSRKIALSLASIFFFWTVPSFLHVLCTNLKQARKY